MCGMRAMDGAVKNAVAPVFVSAPPDLSDNRQPLLFIQNFISDAAFGVEGQADCPLFTDRDFVQFSLTKRF